MNFSDRYDLHLEPLLEMIAPLEPPLGIELTGRLLTAAAGFHDEEGGCHGLDHSCRVHATALHIGRQMGARLDIISAAALLHDIGRPDESRTRGKICHAARGAELARDILDDAGFNEDAIERITHCVATHRFRSDNPPLTLEARIIFDADKLDSIGAIGIGRAFLFAGQVGARLHNHDIDIDTTSPYTVEDTAYREFQVKLSRVRERMMTDPGRQLAEERHRFMETFFDRLDTEISGNRR